MEIVKKLAHDICSSLDPKAAEDCPYLLEDGECRRGGCRYLECAEKLIEKHYHQLPCPPSQMLAEKEALLKENEDLHAFCTELIRKCARLNDEVADLRAISVDIEWSTKRILEADKKVAELTEENERLKAEKDMLDILLKDLWAIAEQYKKQFEEARADTVRDMVDRIKDETWHHVALGYIVYLADIEQIAQEIQGEWQ